ncbi:MAG: patatin-like phospholipase family protein [Chloroflexi bacterium]|nr:patatin-like phospholipase family protein [Chloroflexota bacterium]
MSNDNRRRIALVIGSGSIKCAAAIGLQRVLQREGIPIDMLVGCSGGSIYAALMALGVDAQTLDDMTRRLWTRDLTAKHSLRALASVVLPQLFGFSERFGLVDDRRMNALMTEVFGERTFADAKIPLFITATDFMNGQQVVLDSGRLYDAVRGSLAMPYVFKPHTVGGHVLVDGYLSDPLPVGVAVREDADIIIAMGFESPYLTHISSMLRFAFQTSAVMANNLLKANFAFHSMAHHSEILLILPEFGQHIGLFDVDKSPQIIEAGERAITEQLPYLRELLATPAGGDDARA